MEILLDRSKKLIFVLLIGVFLLTTQNIKQTLAENYGGGNYGANLYGKDTPEPPPANAKACIDTAPASSPTVTSAVSNNGSEIDITISSAQDPVTYYALEYGTQSGIYPYSSTNIGDKSARRYTIRFLYPNTTYYLRIRAGNGCMTGEWSREIYVKTKSAIATNNLNFAKTTFESTTKIIPEQPSTGENPLITTERELYSLTVLVTNTLDNPVQGAQVTIDSEPQIGTTDEMGLVHFDNIEKGQHQLFVSFKKYSGEESIFIDGSARNIKLNIKIKTDNIMFSNTTIIVVSILCFIILLLLVFLFRYRKNHKQN